MKHALTQCACSVTLLAMLFTLTGCGGPSPTSRTVAVSDLVGVWQYSPIDAHNVTVELELKPDGSYSQQVNLPGSVKRVSGQWRIEDNYVTFDALYTGFDQWSKPTPESWPILDRDESPAGFAIFGGAIDPDSWVVMDWRESES